MDKPTRILLGLYLISLYDIFKIAARVNRCTIWYTIRLLFAASVIRVVGIALIASVGVI